MPQTIHITHTDQSTPQQSYYPYYSSASQTFSVFFFNNTAPTEIYTLSLHDALPILVESFLRRRWDLKDYPRQWMAGIILDRKSTRLNSSHVKISYAVFCLKKKKHNTRDIVGTADHSQRDRLMGANSTHPPLHPPVIP